MPEAPEPREANKRAAQQVIDVWDGDDLDGLDDVVAEDVVVDMAFPDQMRGRDAYKEALNAYRSAFPDLTSEANDVVAEDDTVAVHYTARGTHEGELMGIEPTGISVEASGFVLYRFDDGTIVEVTNIGDPFGLIQQRGGVEPLAEGMPTATDIDEPAIDQFQETLRGQLIQPEDTEYDDARTVYNAMIDKHPQLIVQCANVADVIAAVNFGREHDLETAIRGGGHNGPGLALVDDGLVIDLSEMTGIRVNPDAQSVRVEPGCTWGDVDHATHAFGLATPSGIISTTGVSGLTLGGGHGYLTRKYGLTIDNLVSADVVLADGRLVRASEDENPDLFWALRGGGGNFGVVTSFEYQLHPVDTVIGGPFFWPIEKLGTTMRWYREWLPQLPREVSPFYLIHEVPGEPFPEVIHGETVCGLVWCSTGPEDQIEDLLGEARDVAEPLFEHVDQMPYPAIQSLFDDLYPPGDQWYWKGDFVHDLTDEAITEHKRHSDVPTPKSGMHLYPIDGAPHDVDADETAWNYRDATWSMVIFGVDPDPANADKISDWASDYWEAVHPHTAKGAYVNFMMEEGEDRIRSTYGGNYERLQKVKAKYDPNNFFHVNQNIEPAP